MGIFTYFKEPDRRVDGEQVEENGNTVMVGVFKTNIHQHKDAANLRDILHYLVQPIRITFDLEDCDKIMRIEAENFDVFEVINTVNVCGFNCELLD
ncbi:MAG TPA: hypothetical protein H9825_03475 [Candidatus Sphingobacterium stercorigallinarum]|nr:hypothetical protein [Candidatus Sphingobacterium stercorigallinarum]